MISVFYVGLSLLLADPQSTSVEHNSGSHVSNKTLENKVDEYIRPLVDRSDFYGTVLFAKNGKIQLVKGYGYANIEHQIKNNKDTVFHIASLNKPITSIGIMKLHQDGKIDINKAINQYISGYPNGNIITIKHLLSQTSGIPSYNRFSDYQEFAQRENTLTEIVNWFKAEELLFEPGSQYQYSNSNYVLLAHIIEQVTQMRYEAYLNQAVFEPLQMNHTRRVKYDEIVLNRAAGYSPASNQFGLDPIGYYNNSLKVGSGALFSTVLDLFQLEEIIYSNKILNQETRQLMFTNVNDSDYALGWGNWKRFDLKKYDHDGSSPGSVAYFSTYPDEKVTIIFLGNINSGVFRDMKYDLAAIYFKQAYEIPTTMSYLQLAESTLKKYEGIYHFDNGNFFAIKLLSGQLRFLWMGRGDSGYLLSPISHNELFMRARGDRIRFEFNNDKLLNATYIEPSGPSKLTKE